MIGNVFRKLFVGISAKNHDVILEIVLNFSFLTMILFLQFMVVVCCLIHRITCVKVFA